METKPTLRVKKLPLIIKKGNVSFLKGNFRKNEGHFTPNVKFTPLYKEDLLYETTDVYYLKGEFQRMTLVHSLNVVTKVNRTVAKYFSKDGSVVEKTSDRVALIIGQEQYRTIFTALCSIIDQELKIRSILALLTMETDAKSESNADSLKTFKDKFSQTQDQIEPMKSRPRKRVRRQPGPYIVKDNTDTKKGKKIIVNIIKPIDNDSDSTEKDSNSVVTEISDTVSSETTKKSERKKKSRVKSASSRNSTDSLQDLGFLYDDYSNDSLGNYSALSDTPTILLTNPTSILKNVDKHTQVVENTNGQQNYPIRLGDGTDVIVPFQPEDMFHITKKENLAVLDKNNRKKLLMHQLLIDYKHCHTVMDEDGNLPLHLAVLNNDLELLGRQCVVLKVQGRSLDISANGLTALQLALQASASAELAACLVRHGADPLRVDGGHRAAAHLAAEGDADRLRALMHACHHTARKILSENEELWKPGMETCTDEQLGQILMKHMCSMFDRQGYTPLMLASMLGLYENVRVLLEHSPRSVNDKMPTSGNTALYLAVAAACNSSSERGNKSKIIDHFRKTIEILLENGADPAIDNHAGSNVNVLLTEFNCAELSMLIANKLTQVNLDNQVDTTQNCDKIMLVLDKEGKLEFKTLENERKKKTVKKDKPEVETTDTKTDSSKPVILENIPLKSAGNTEKHGTEIKLNTEIVESVKVQQIVLKGKSQNTAETNKKVVILRNMVTPNNQDKKRKMEDKPKVTKQAKVQK